MKRALFAASLTVAVAAFAAEPYTLDRNGVFWRVEATPSGTALVATKEGVELTRSLVPFALGIAGQHDSNLQLVADELSGKVVLAWQRNFSEAYSEIMLASWRDGSWERVEYLVGAPALRPRNPVLRLAQAQSSYPDPEDPEHQLTVKESFALLAWWEGDSRDQRARLAVLRLTAEAHEEGGLELREVPTSPGIGFNCPQPLAEDTVERPTFASQPPGPISHLLVASPNTCFLLVHEIRFALAPPQEQEGGISVEGTRRRHTPIFGVRRILPVTRELATEGTKVVLGAHLEPVLYQVLPDGLRYVVASERGWSEPRKLAIGPELSLDKAIALVENLAR